MAQIDSSALSHSVAWQHAILTDWRIKNLSVSVGCSKALCGGDGNNVASIFVVFVVTFGKVVGDLP